MFLMLCDRGLFSQFWTRTCHQPAASLFISLLCCSLNAQGKPSAPALWSAPTLCSVLQMDLFSWSKGVPLSCQVNSKGAGASNAGPGFQHAPGSFYVNPKAKKADWKRALMCFSQDQGIIPAQASFLFLPTVYGLWECYKMRRSVPDLKSYKIIFFHDLQNLFLPGLTYFLFF